MKAYGFHGVLGLGILVGAIVFCFASAATPLEENAPSAPSQQRSQTNQPNKTKSKQNTSAALKQKQSKNSKPPESNTQRTNANSRPQVESRRSERRQEKADLIMTAAGVLLNAIQKPAPNPTPPPAPVVVKTAPAQQKTTPHKRTPPKSSDDGLWSRINPISKDLSGPDAKPKWPTP